MTKVNKGGPRRSSPDMIDPADRDVHSGAKRKGEAGDDLRDPSVADPNAPHERGVQEGDELIGARQDIIRKVEPDLEAWRKGETQNK